ncbi:MAG: 2-amino-4-hydroxy-6-hydroxymethyldihydropteridine diphosphokinase [Melioribacteraceae bacterium]|jgi:2-amino-4-hydroxy-6-hydroxymethyldihydropteridine diphosphokinase|nr:2-amino-4-hydroxy-6-hydroxymethyldihydropteridine diphosphokinase [Melioribacteraceae bacterium]
MVSNIFLGLGSNVGDRLSYLKLAVERILKAGNCFLKKSSSIYETRPYGNLELGNFFNAVIQIDTALKPDELFEFVKRLEIEIGRKETKKKWAPREIDIDILFYNQLIYNENYLVIPHPAVLKRDFVLIPIIEISSDFSHPVIRKKLCNLDLNLLESYIINKTDHKLI